MKQKRETYLLNGSRMVARAGTITKLHLDCSGRCRNETKKETYLLIGSRSARTGRDNYKTALKLLGAVLE